MNRPTRAEVDLSAIRDNIRLIRERVGPAVKIIPAVKADGYGHGAVEASGACLDGGADALAVANVDEGIQLREAGFSWLDVPILILGCSEPAVAGEIVRYDIASTCCDLEFANALSGAAYSQEKIASVHIKVDTGMGRIGVAAEEAVEFAAKVAAMPALSVDGVFTHFPCSDEADRLYTSAQIARFAKVISDIRALGGKPFLAHASNSGAILAYPEADLDAVRPGIMTYGSYPSPEVARSIAIREALTLRTRIVFVKEVEAGATVSYGRTHTLKRHSRVATLPIGYGDGYPRLLSNKGEVAVRGARVPIIGRVCMDQCLADVTDVPGVQVGDEVVLYGGGYDYLSVSTVAEKVGTISYELLCNISKRVPRVYVQQNP